MEKKFKPFDRVIIRQGNRRWKADFYSHFEKLTSQHKMVSSKCVGCRDILPFDEYSHLLGTTDSPDEEVRLEEGEFLVCFDCMDYFEAKDFCLSPLDSLRDSTVRTKDGNNWKLFIRFSDFNPNDMEATCAKILCVKNGRIVKLKK